MSLSGPEKILMLIGVVGLVLCTIALLMGVCSRDARMASRLGLWSLATSVGCLTLLAILNVSGATGSTHSFLYLGAAILGWMIAVMLPVALRVQRCRRRKGWPLQFNGEESDT